MKEFLINEDGQAVVEFAIIAPILLLILCGIIDFSWIFSAKLATNNCAREGAPYAATSSAFSTVQCDTEKRINIIATDNIKKNIITSVKYSNTCNPGSGDVTVTVTSQVKALTVVADTIFGGDKIEISSSVTMKVG